MLVFSDLRLANGATDITREVTRTVARAIEECRGPGVVVLAGDVFDLRDGTDIESALAAHPRFAAALALFVAGQDHRLVVLPGTRDRALAYDSRTIDAITTIGGEVALACALEVDTGVGTRLVQVEPGHRLDPTAAFADPRDPNDRPLALHVARDIGPGSRPTRRTARGWPGSTISPTAASPARSSHRGSRTAGCCAGRRGCSCRRWSGWRSSCRSSS